MKEALLTVSFGTAVEQARQSDICAVERAAAQALPHLPAYQAYTSPTIRRILARRGVDIPGFVPALEQLAQDGVERVYVLPTHLLPGYEYDDLLEAAGQLRPQFQQLRMAPPLLGTPGACGLWLKFCAAVSPAKRDRPWCCWATAPSTRATWSIPLSRACWTG